MHETIKSVYVVKCKFLKKRDDNCLYNMFKVIFDLNETSIIQLLMHMLSSYWIM